MTLAVLTTVFGALDGAMGVTAAGLTAFSRGEVEMSRRTVITFGAENVWKAVTGSCVLVAEGGARSHRIAGALDTPAADARLEVND